MGDMKATRCTFEGNGLDAIFVYGGGSSELVDCVICNNRGSGVYVTKGKGGVMLRGGAISENKRDGVYVWSGAKVTVAKAEEGKPQTVCKDNTLHDWCTDTGEGSEIIGISQEKIHGQ